MSKCHIYHIGIQFEDSYIKKKKKVMKKIYLLDLFNLMSSDLEMNTTPKENDPNWTKTVEEFQNGDFITKKEIWTSIDGTSKYVKTYTESKKKRSEDVKMLESELKIAVEKEEYEKAAKLRDQIKELKK
jgi:excinuclease UvrABC helicase subunit UvrB